MRYHGSYCGPTWSDSEFQESVCGMSTAQSSFDQTCKDHDCAYYNQEDLTAADLKFAAENLFSVDSIRPIAGFGVGVQGMTRALDSVLPTFSLFPRMTKRLRSTNGNGKKATQNPGAQARRGGQRKLAGSPATDSRGTMVSRGVPVSIGTTVTTSRPIVKSVSGGIVVTGREFAGAVYSFASTSAFSAAASVPVAPAFFLCWSHGEFVALV